MSMKFGKVSKTKDLNEYDDVRIVGKTFPHDETIEQIRYSKKTPFYLKWCFLIRALEMKSSVNWSVLKTAC